MGLVFDDITIGKRDVKAIEKKTLKEIDIENTISENKDEPKFNDNKDIDESNDTDYEFLDNFEPTVESEYLYESDPGLILNKSIADGTNQLEISVKNNQTENDVVIENKSKQVDRDK